MRHIFKWSGAPLGFIHGSALFGCDGRYLGWAGQDGRVWLEDGSYIGELIEGEYILRNTLRPEPPPQVPRAPPMLPIPPPAPKSRKPRPPRAGWVDPFEQPASPPRR